MVEETTALPETPPPRPASLLSSADLAIDVIRSAADLTAVRERTADRRAVERLLCDRAVDRESWSLPGFCKVCAQAVSFEGDWKYSYDGTVNFRERLVCPGCNLNNRMRFMASLLMAAYGGATSEARTYLYEQVTPFFTWATRTLQGTVVGSEYLGHGVAGGSTVQGVRHEDALALSFANASFDSIVSNDVFEHVPDIDGSLAECARILRPGGRLYFSIPFQGKPQTAQRAALRDGEIVELLAPEYHANPVDEKGSLVFYDHGWDILQRCRRCGFADAYVLSYWSLLYGHIGEGLQLMFVAEMA